MANWRTDSCDFYIDLQLATYTVFRPKRFLRFHLGRFFPFGRRKTCAAWGWWGLWPGWTAWKTLDTNGTRCFPLRFPLQLQQFFSLGLCATDSVCKPLSGKATRGVAHSMAWVPTQTKLGHWPSDLGSIFYSTLTFISFQSQFAGERYL